MKLKTVLRVQNRQGLHARPATAIAKLLQPLESSVSFSYEQETIDAKSALGILMLAAAFGSEIEVEIEGCDAEKTKTLLEKIFKEQFGEG